MLKSCKYCGRIHESSYDCGQKPKRAKESTEHTKLRTCRKWDTTRKKVLARDHYLCRVCFSQHRINAEYLEVHHIVPLADNPAAAYDTDNLITLCTKHHKEADAGKIKRDVLKCMASSDMTI